MHIYLYVKTHNKTGFKYLGKTSRKDPHKYPGSGKRWLRHLKKHGYDYTTEILLATEDKNVLKEEGLRYSKLWRVTESDDWANLRDECGDGGDTSNTENYILGMKNRDLSGKNNPMYKRSAITKNNLKWYTDGNKNIYVTEGTQPENFSKGRFNLKRKPHSDEHKKKISKSLTGKPASNRKTVISPEGLEFLSIKKAASYCNLTVSQFKYRMLCKGNWKVK
jgi:hypothetical protein